MKKNRCFKLTALLLAMIMMISMVPAFALGDASTGETEPFDIVLASANLADKVKTRTILDKDKKLVTDLAAADPNGSFTLNLEVEEAEGAQGEDALPENNKAPMLYALENMTAKDGGNEVVNWHFDAKSGNLIFSWVNGKKTGFSASVSIEPKYPEVEKLAGSYALVAATNKMVTDTVLKYDNRARVASTDVKASGSGIRAESWQNTIWTLTHVTGEWYTVSSNNGNYMKLRKGNHLDLTGAEGAQKIRIQKSAVEGYYVFSADSVALDNSGGGVEKGFSAWEYAGDPKKVNDNEKIKLVPASNLVKDATKDLTGTWAILHKGNKAILSSREYSGNSTRISADLFAMMGDQYFPYNNNVTLWQFEHVAGDWYYVSANGQYLNVTDKGIALSETKQPLKAATTDNYNTIIFATEEYANRAYSLVLVDGKAASGFGSTKYNTGNNNEKLTLVSAAAISGSTTSISGSYAIINESTGAALRAAVRSDNGNRLESVTYFTYPDGTIESKGAEIPVWTFTQVTGDWYTVKTGDKYLRIAANQLQLTDEPAEIFIQENNGKYRLTDGFGVALNNVGGNASNGFQAITNGTIEKEWVTLAHLNTGIGTYLLFDVNGGDIKTPPTVGMVEAGETVKLPDYYGTKNKASFVGWADVKNIYETNPGKNHSYREVYLPGTSYTVSEGKKILYAVFNEKGTDVTFGFRLDGTIPEEPGNYDRILYGGDEKHIKINGALKYGRWAVDVDSGKQIVGNHLDNDVIVNLNTLPTDAQIKKAMPEYDPETMYVHWYVLKYAGSWKVDGVLRAREGKTVTYKSNMDGLIRDEIKNMPLGYPLSEDSIKAGADVTGTVLHPELEGYDFLGWNTSADGTGESYEPGNQIQADGDVTLYAQWDEALTVTIISSVAGQEKVYSGTEIVLTAVRGGAYQGPVTIQWERVDPVTGEKEVIPGAEEMEYRFTINAENAKYLYRITLTPVSE